MKTQFCWLCGSTDIWDSGLCHRHYIWAENTEERLNPSGPVWGEEDLRIIFDAQKSILDGRDPAGKEWKR